MSKLAAQVLMFFGSCLLLLPWFAGHAIGFGINLMQPTPEDKIQSICTLALLRKYFDSGDELSGAVLSMTLTTSAVQLQEQLLRYINHFEGLPWTVLVTNPRQKRALDEQILDEKPQCYFLVVDNLEDDLDDLDEVFDYWKGMLNWNPLAQFVVYLASVEETDEDMTDLMVELLLTFMNKKIFNVNVIGQSDESSNYFGKTVFPYDADNNCGNRVIVVEVLDACIYQQQEDTEEEQLEDEDIDENTAIETIEASNESEELENQSLARYTQAGNIQQPIVTIEQHLRAKFNDKFPRDLSGCTLPAAFRPWEPYIFSVNEPAEEDYYNAGGEQAETDNSTDASYDDNEDYDFIGDGNEQSQTAAGVAGNVKLAGIEYQMVQTIAERLNIQINLRVENTNLYHLFQKLIEGEIDMIVGGIDEDPRISQFVSSSVPYLQDDLTWCMAKAKRKHSFFNFLASFNRGSWLLLLLFILTDSLALHLAQRISGYRLRSLFDYVSICIRIIGIILNQAINASGIPLPLGFRLLFAVSFLMAFFFSNIYQSFLISTLTTPRSSHQISHLAELPSNRMTLMSTVENVRHLNKQGEIFKYMREKFQMCYNIVDCLNYAADNEHIAVGVSRQHSFYNPRIQRDRLYCFDRNENLYVYPVTMLLPKKYHLLHQINPVIQHIIESGLMQKWARDLDMVRMIQEEIRRAREDPFKSLTLAQFHGAFLFANGLLLLASYIFGLECLAYWCVARRRTRLKLLRCLHRRLGGSRCVSQHC